MPTGRSSYSRQGGASPAMPRAASPQPPQPAFAQSQSQSRPGSRAAPSPVPAQAQPSPKPAYANPRPQSRAAPAQPSPQPAYATPRPQSRAAPSSRAVSPQPQFRQSYDRPSSSRSDMASSMAVQLAPGPGSERGDGSVYGGSVYGGSMRGRTNTNSSQRPQSSYYAGSASEPLRHSPSQMSSRVRSKSVAEPRQYTRDGRMILHYCKFQFPLFFHRVA